MQVVTSTQQGMNVHLDTGKGKQLAKKSSSYSSYGTQISDDPTLQESIFSVVSYEDERSKSINEEVKIEEPHISEIEHNDSVKKKIIEGPAITSEDMNGYVLVKAGQNEESLDISENFCLLQHNKYNQEDERESSANFSTETENLMTMLASQINFDDQDFAHSTVTYDSSRTINCVSPYVQCSMPTANSNETIKLNIIKNERLKPGKHVIDQFASLKSSTELSPYIAIQKTLTEIKECDSTLRISKQDTGQPLSHHIICDEYSDSSMNDLMTFLANQIDFERNDLIDSVTFINDRKDGSILNSRMPLHDPISGSLLNSEQSSKLVESRNELETIDDQPSDGYNVQTSTHEISPYVLIKQVPPETRDNGILIEYIKPEIVKSKSNTIVTMAKDHENQTVIDRTWLQNLLQTHGNNILVPSSDPKQSNYNLELVPKTNSIPTNKFDKAEKRENTQTETSNRSRNNLCIPNEIGFIIPGLGKQEQDNINRDSGFGVPEMEKYGYYDFKVPKINKDFVNTLSKENVFPDRKIDGPDRSIDIVYSEE